MARANKSRHTQPVNGHARINWEDNGRPTTRHWRDIQEEAGPVRMGGANGSHGLGIAGRPRGQGGRDDGKPEKVYLRPDQVVIDTPGQIAFADALRTQRIIWGIGSAGAGKSFLAVRDAVEKLQSGRVKGIVFMRPAVEAGETLGFQPGDTDAKISGYMEPLLIELGKFYSPADIKAMRSEKVVRTLALQFLRGYNLEDMAVILDEAHNAPAGHIQLLLQRMCKGTSIAILGDLERNPVDHPDGPTLKQSDLKPELQGGLEYWSDKFLHLKGIKKVVMTPLDCHRDPLVRAMQAEGL